MPARVALGLVALLAAAGCGGGGGGGAGGRDGGAADGPARDAGGPHGGYDAQGTDVGGGGGGDGGGGDSSTASCDASRLPTDDVCVVNEAYGVFVSASQGSATGDGTRSHPLASLDAAIATAAVAGKRVYACAETYAEPLVMHDGVSVFGYFDCGAGWRIGAARAKVAPAVSPAAEAANVTTPTRVESVDIVAPDFTDHGQSSIGLLVSAAPALTIAHATIHAGTGGRGDDGAAGVQLTDSGSAKNGAASWADGVCGGVICYQGNFYQPAGGSNTCTGETGHDGGAGGAGGFPGTFLSSFFVSSYIWYAQDQGTTAGSPPAATPETARGGALASGGTDGASGADGSAGAGGAAVGVVAASGYTPSDGTAGTAGAAGQGGGGSGGANDLTVDYPPSNYAGKLGWAEPGAGGGAGGCPGLPAQPGKGGGASIGVIAVASPFTLDDVTVESSAGGAAGMAGVPSAPTSGGLGGQPSPHTFVGGSGGPGGHAGVSGNGGGGPSIALAYQGTEPTLTASKVTPGSGGAGVAQRVANGQTIPATPDGLSSGAYAF